MRKLRIVVVDDLNEDLALTRHVLTQCKLLNPISFFRSGDECIAHIEAVQQVGPCERPEPAIIFLDMIMAPTSGLDILRYLEKSAYSKHCIVVMLSGLKDIRAINEGYLLGAKTFLLKPITAHDVVNVLNALGQCIFIEEAEGGYQLDWKGHITHAENRPGPPGEIILQSASERTLSA